MENGDEKNKNIDRIDDGDGGALNDDKKLLMMIFQHHFHLII